MSGPLLATKTHIPRTRGSLVTRPRLLAQLDAGLSCPLTLIAAPAGFGKTTLLCEWLQANSCRAAWVSLDEGDSDPARFWAYVLAALESLVPGIGNQSAGLAGEAEPDAVEALLTGLINALDVLPGDCVLVLDDYHAIESPEIHHELAFLINHLPPQMHVFLTTRADPALPLSRWRARGQLNEIRTSSLRFNGEETEAFLGDSMGLDLEPGAASALGARTEGWIAGLQLAALALRTQDAPHAAGFVAASAGSNRFVLDYLVDEVLRREPESVQSFLLQTSILEHLTASLCDWVTGRSDGQAMLELLERANLFITSTDGERQWFRYHTLFADLLQKLLGQTYPGLAPELHLRASVWYEEYDFAAEAIGHALAARDEERAATLIERAARATLRRGELSTLSAWLSALDDGTLQAHPALCAYKARILIADGDLDGAAPLLLAAEQQIPAGLPNVEARALRGQIATMRAVLAAQVADVPGMLAHAGEALSYLPEDRAFLRDLSSWIQDLAYELSGERPEAETSLREALGRTRASGSTLLVLLSTYAFGLFELTHGRLSLASELYERALRHLAQRERLPEPAGLVYLGFGELCRARGDLALAEQHLNTGLELVKRRAERNAPVQGLISMAWVRQAYGDEQGVLAALEEAESLARAGTLSPHTVTQLKAHRARLALRRGDLDGAQRWARGARLREPPAGNDLEAPYLYQVVQSTWARLLIAEGRPRDALAVLAPLRIQAEQAGWVRVSTSLAVLAALAANAGGDVEGALRELRSALEVAEPEGYIRLLADEGPSVATLLREGARRGSWDEPHLATYAERVLAACPPQHRPRTSASAHAMPPVAPAVVAAASLVDLAPIEPLTEREGEILGLLDQGLSYREIGDHLYLSLGTVKTHVHHIYGKLAAEDRQRALLRARELHLI